MTLLPVAPTKSNLLAVRRQLAFAEEGFDLLDQKRQILTMELLGRLRRARSAEERMGNALRRAFAAWTDATLAAGTHALEVLGLAIPPSAGVAIATRKLMGVALPEVKPQSNTAPPLPISDGAVVVDHARFQILQLLPDLAELATLQTDLFRLGHELRRTQRRCNALSRIFIPAHRETIAFIASTLEEREREFLVVLRRIRDRAAAGAGPASLPG